MLTGIDVKETKPFTSSQDEGENKTTFHIGNLSNRQKIDLIGDLMDQQGKVDSRKIQEKAIDIFLMGVRRIENFFDPVKKQAVSVHEITEGIADMVPFLIVCEVAGKIVEWNFVGEDERKN